MTWHFLPHSQVAHDSLVNLDLRVHWVAAVPAVAYHQIQPGVEHLHLFHPGTWAKGKLLVHFLWPLLVHTHLLVFFWHTKGFTVFKHLFNADISLPNLIRLIQKKRLLEANSAFRSQPFCLLTIHIRLFSARAVVLMARFGLSRQPSGCPTVVLLPCSEAITITIVSTPWVETTIKSNYEHTNHIGSLSTRQD